MHGVGPWEVTISPGWQDLSRIYGYEVLSDGQSFSIVKNWCL